MILLIKGGKLEGGNYNFNRKYKQFTRKHNQNKVELSCCGRNECNKMGEPEWI